VSGLESFFFPREEKKQIMMQKEALRIVFRKRETSLKGSFEASWGNAGERFCGKEKKERERSCRKNPLFYPFECFAPRE